ncbi:hypothetical protein DFQ26_003160 [Actinomortierella ambigua]|nr:hypothetical protein DFQ26_003160 [Actinomortierella ambigua]
MKSVTSLVILAAAASSALAVIPRPVPGCIKFVMVQEDIDFDGCDAFAARHGTTFEHIFAWNDKLSWKCDNLDAGHPICIDNPSVPPAKTRGAPRTGPTGTKVSYSPYGPAPTVAGVDPKKDGPSAGSPPAPSTTPPPPKGGAPGNGSPSAPPVPPKVDADGAGTPSAPAPAPTGATSSTVSVPTPTGASRPASLNKPNSEGSTNVDSSAGVNKGSLFVAAAGVVMSVAYML